MTATLERRVSQRNAERLVQFPKEIMDQIEELRSLYEKASTKRDRREIISAVAELLCPEGPDTSAVDPEEGIDSQARTKVDEYRKKVGLAIKKRRESLNMTQEDLAGKAGLPQSHVSRLERGVHAPTHLTMKRLAKALKTRASSLDPGFDD